MAPEFKVSEDDGVTRDDTNVSISLMDLKKFNQIKGNMAFYSGRKVSSKEVMQELLMTWYESKREQVLRNGDSN